MSAGSANMAHKRSWPSESFRSRLQFMIANPVASFLMCSRSKAYADVYGAPSTDV